MSNMEKTLLEIKDMTAALNKSTDSITAAILAVDRYLTSCGVGIVVTFPIRTGALVYRRYQSTFHIVYEKHGKPLDDAVPLASAPREVKIEAAEYLTGFVEAFWVALDEKIKSARNADSAVTELVSRLPKVQDPPPPVVDDVNIHE